MQGATPRSEFPKHEIHEPSVHDQDLPFPTKEVGITAGYSTFSMESLKTNVLIWGLFMCSSVRKKPRSALNNQVLGRKERATLPAQHTLPLSLQPSRAFRTPTKAALVGSFCHSDRSGHRLSRRTRRFREAHRQGGICKRQPKQQTKRGSRQCKVTTAQPSRIQQCQTLNRVALPRRTLMTTPKTLVCPTN